MVVVNKVHGEVINTMLLSHITCLSLIVFFPAPLCARQHLRGLFKLLVMVVSRSTLVCACKLRTKGRHAVLNAKARPLALTPHVIRTVF